MRIKRLAIAGGILLAVALAAIAIAIHFVDARAFAMSLAASVKADTGRELEFGDVNIKVLPRPALVLSEVRFGNAGWGSQPWLAQAVRVKASVDALELLAGRLRIKHIEMSGASVLIETDGEGNGNWVTGRADASSPAWLKTIEIDEFSLEGLTLTYRDGTTGTATSLHIDAAEFAAGSAANPIHIDMHASFHDKKLEASGKIGALASLIANAPAYPVDLDGKFGAGSFSAHGTIDQPREFGRFNLALRAQLPEFADYAALFGASVPPLGPFRGATQLTGTRAAPVFSGIDIELGTPERMSMTTRGELAGTLAVGGNYEWQSNGIEFVAQGAQFSDFEQWFGKSLPALGPYRIAARMTDAANITGLSAIDATFGGRGTPEIKLRGAIVNLRAASGIDLQLAASANEWWRPGTAANGPRMPPFRASARVRDARQGYRVDDLELKIAGTTVSASLQVARAGQRFRVAGKAAAPLIDLTRLAPGTDSAGKSAVSGASRSTDYWKLADVDLDLKIGRLVFPDGRELQSGSGRLALDQGRLKASALQATLGGAKVKLDGTVEDPQQLAGLDLAIALQGGELAEFFKFFGRKIPPVGPFQGRAQLHGSLDALSMTAIDTSAGRSGQNLRASGQIADALKWQGVELAITANIGDSTAAARLFGADVPRLPALRATARVTGPKDGYVFDDLKLALGHTSVQGRVAFAPGEPRPRVTANLSGPLVDLSELPSVQPKADAANPLLAADMDANVNFSRVVLPDRRALGPVSGSARLTAGAVELKQFTVAVDGASATLDGRINDPLKPAALELTVNARLERGAGLAAFTGLSLQNLPAFTASARLTDVPDGYALTGLKFSGEATTIAGDVAITRGAKRFKVSAKANSPLLDISAYMPSATEDGAKKPVAPSARAIPDVPLPLDPLRAIDADLDLRFDKVKIGDAALLGPLLVRATIADGLLKAEPVQLTAEPGQTLSVSGTVDAAQSAWALRVEGTGIDFGAMLTRFGRPNVVTGGSTDFTLQFEGRGKSLPAVLGSLSGDVRLKVGPYRIHNFAVPLGGGTVMHMFGLANPFLKADPDTDVKCLTARVPIKNGIITSERRVATETAKYNAVMSGTVNLRTEEIDLSVTPVVRGEVKTVVHLRGTLAAPVVEVNAVGAVAKSAASLGASVVTLGGWWMADTLINKAASDPSPCATALAQ